MGARGRAPGRAPRLRLLDAAGSRSRGRLCCVLDVAAARILRVQPEVTRSFAAGPFPRGGGDSRRDRDARRLAKRRSPARPVVVCEPAAPNALEIKFAGLVGRGVVSFGEIGERRDRRTFSSERQVSSFALCRWSAGTTRGARSSPLYCGESYRWAGATPVSWTCVHQTGGGSIGWLRSVDMYGYASKPTADRRIETSHRRERQGAGDDSGVACCDADGRRHRVRSGAVAEGR